MTKSHWVVLFLAFFVVSFPAAAQPSNNQQAQVELNQVQQSAQTRTQALQQSSQQDFQAFQQTSQQWQQTVQQTQSATWQRLSATGGLTPQVQQAYQADQLNIQQITQAVQQLLNQGQQTAQSALQQTQQAVQQDLQQLSQTINSGNYGAMAALEQDVDRLLATGSASIKQAFAQTQTVYAQKQAAVQALLDHQSALGGSTTPPVTTPPVTTPVAVNGACGSSSGSTVATAPSGNLCNSGSASAVGGSGPWNWSCAGNNGGSTAQCSAAKTAVSVVNGACGSSSGLTLAAAPSGNLCNTGSASAVGGNGPWSWNCAGSNGGSTAQCSAAKAVTQANRSAFSFTTAASYDAQYGSQMITFAPYIGYIMPGEWVGYSRVDFGGGANSVAISVAVTGANAGQGIEVRIDSPTGMVAGTLKVADTGSWSSYAMQSAPIATVSGIHNVYLTFTGFGGVANIGGFQFSAQTASNPPINGACGASSGQSLSSAPNSGLCSRGVASAIAGNGPWGWTCAGSDGGTTAQCSASSAVTSVSGVCGTANGQTLSSAPANGLCATGSASAVSGSNPWNWSCAGSGSGSTAQCATAAAVGVAFFVSPSGNDANNGSSPSSPFQTLERAQGAMQSSTVKTTYLMGGIYNRSQPLSLTNWNDGGTSWLAYPGQKPVLDGGRRATAGVYIMASNVTVKGLTIQNFTENGIFAKWCDNLVFANNSILNMTSPDWRTGILGASIFVIHSKNDLITHNLINGNTGQGIEVNGGGADDIQSNAVVSYNAVYNVCSATDDCGGIYFRDTGHQSINMSITNNIVAGVLNSGTKGIYIDDETSNVTITNNIVYGSSQYAFQIHGGDHVVIQNNIFDVSQMDALALYQDDVTSGFPNYGMGSNVFTNNIVYSSGSPKRLWDYLNGSGGFIATPAVHDNLYYAASGSFSNSGTITDGRTVSGNPGFANPGAANYSFTSNAANQTIGFQSINQGAVGPQ